MMDFEFPEVTRAKLLDVNLRSEQHGETLIPATDVRLSLDVPNDVLARYRQDLREWLFMESTQDQLPGIEQVSNWTELRFPELNYPLKWTSDSYGYDLTIDYGIDESKQLRLSDCKLHKHTLTPKRGGTCNIAFTLTCTDGLLAETLGHLGMHVLHDVHFRLSQRVVELT